MSAEFSMQPRESGAQVREAREIVGQLRGDPDIVVFRMGNEFRRGRGC